MFWYLFEIRNKFILIFVTFFSALLVCYFYKGVLLFLITQMHLNNENLYFTFNGVTELFSTHFRLIFFVLIQIVAWYLFYHFFSFLRPAFYPQEFRFVNFFFNIITFLLLISGFLSSYFLIPVSWDFFLSFHEQQDFYFEAGINEYFAFYNDVYFLSLAYCQLFTLLFFLLLNIKQNYSYIKKYKKLHYYLFFIFSVLITPPDFWSQIVTFFFIGIVYEIVIFSLIFDFFSN